MIGIVYVSTLKDLLYNDFAIGGNGGSESLGRAFLTFLVTEAEAADGLELFCLVGAMV